ncbi:unnamed protein product [Cylicostephanus goldi]|uniref:SXP/RAL-2 family protein Ani s 5-like cation-binding domain-containing protein n=1 Tax=Cylicostephanus goldi TaxID=71465 RepID=A0A3P6QID0_CYLGO|nr:unnamed protein product [Cylicostephanus goldi]
MRAFIFATLLVALCYADDSSLFIDELEELVPSMQDKNELEGLEEDETMIRYDKKKKLDEILARQSEDIKKAYAMQVEREKLKHRENFEKKMVKATNPAVKEYLQQIEAINNDLSISEQSAKEKIKNVGLTTFPQV